MANILVSTLGTNWEIIAETIGFTNYRKNDFYKNHSDLTAIQQKRSKELFSTEVDELWLLATDNPHTKIHGREFNSTEENFEQIRRWNYNVGSCVKQIRIWILKDVADIKNEADAEAFHSLALQVIAYAKEQVCKTHGKLFLSLACGRKTMSADMQDAAYCFGCDAMIHIIGEGVTLSDSDIALSADDATKVYPLCLGQYNANVALERCNVNRFSNEEILRCKPDNTFLNEIREKQKESQFFYTSFYLEENQGNRNNFKILYTLAPEQMAKIKSKRFGEDITKYEEEFALLQKLPKTELHCHLGGILDTKDLIDVACCYEKEVNEEKIKNPKFKSWANGLKKELQSFQRPDNWKIWQGDLSKQLGTNQCLINACFLMAFTEEEKLLDSLIFGSYLDEHKFCGIGITTYEALGDLQGSSFLQTEKAIRRAVQILLKKAEQNNVVYLEIRCSPLNYTKFGLSGRQVVNFICEELDRETNIRKSLLLIASRHNNIDKIDGSIKLMKEMDSEDSLFHKYFRGFDLAGDESAKQPHELRDKFEEILRDCKNITIHAGETMPVQSIWDAVYSLNAERVGHGLTLIDNSNLLNKFLERHIGVEMCPSSNLQIVGFRDNYLPETEQLKEYPLREYIEKELLVCINTDDPGISRTNATKELLRAARLTRNGLSLWNIFQLIYNGLQMAFFPYQQKKELINEVEKQIGNLIKEKQI